MSTATDEVTPAAAAATDDALPTAATEVAMPIAATDEALPTASTEEAKKKKVIILKSSDDDTFEVDEAVAVKSQTIKHMIEDECADNGIPLPNVNSEILSKVIEYCKKHVEAEAQPKGGGEGERTMEKELRKFDSDFVKVEQAMLFDLILAANYLDIKSLLDLVSQTVANMIKDKSPEEVRLIFNIKNDFTPEEEEAVRNENPWAFE